MIHRILIITSMITLFTVSLVMITRGSRGIIITTRGGGDGMDMVADTVAVRTMAVEEVMCRTDKDTVSEDVIT